MLILGLKGLRKLVVLVEILAYGKRRDPGSKVSTSFIVETAC